MAKRFSYLRLFTSTFYISAFTFGGGYVIVPLLQKKFVDGLGWVEEEEMLNMIAIAQSSPGAIAINTCILLGYKVAGKLGAVITVTATTLPPLITITVISFFYAEFRDNEVVAAVLRGMQAGVAAVIADVVIGMGEKVAKGRDAINLATMVAAFAATFFLKVNVIIVILSCAALGGVRYALSRRFPSLRVREAVKAAAPAAHGALGPETKTDAVAGSASQDPTADRPPEGLGGGPGIGGGEGEEGR